MAPLRPRSFLIARLPPVGDEWLLSNALSTLPSRSRDEANRAAAKIALKQSALVFRNPKKVDEGWALQREERRQFIAFFGSDLVVFPGRALVERMQAYLDFVRYKVRDAQGKSAAERAQEHYGVVPPALDFGLPADLCAAETVGVIYDEVDGLNFFPDFGLVEEAFANPEQATKRTHRQAVIGYLRDPNIIPLPFRRLAERRPEGASRVFERILKQPGFSWEKDGEALLRRSKASCFERPVLPGVIPIGEALARAQLGATARAEVLTDLRRRACRSKKRRKRR